MRNGEAAINDSVSTRVLSSLSDLVGRTQRRPNSFRTGVVLPARMPRRHFLYARRDTARMRPTGAVILLFGIALLLGTPRVLADDTLPSDLRIVANDEYTKRVPVGENASFAWSLVNVGLADYNVTVTGKVSSSDYALAVVPVNALLRSGEVLTVL